MPIGEIESPRAPVIDDVKPFVEAGFAVHWLHPRQKRPVGKEWQNAPVATLAGLTESYRPGNNVGLRLGEPSRVAGYYAHVIDMDIRVPELADEAWAALRKKFAGVDLDSLPCVQSGSGGESRHLHFVTDKPLFSTKLAVSDGKHRGADGKWHCDWEIELFGTGKQVAMPPSIHPDSGKPYIWLRPFDFDMLDLGIAPHVSATVIETIGAVTIETYGFESREPLEFKPGQLEEELDLVPVSDLDYDDWIRLGQALHHQFGGSQQGFDLWVKHTQRSIKFTGDAQIREMRRIKWRSFGKYRGKPVTMATVRQWVQEVRVANMVDEFEDEPESDEFDDLFDANTGDENAAQVEEKPERAGLPYAEILPLLQLNDKGGIVGTLHNVEMIVKHDQRLWGLAQLNEFTQETVQRTPPGRKSPRRKNAAKTTRQLEGRAWQVRDTLNGELWNDDRDFAVRSIIEAPGTMGGYGIKVSDRDLRAATVLASQSHAFHPVREYLESMTWDGVPRLNNLFTRYVGAPDDAYSRSVSRMMMTAAVTRIYEPGHKWDFAVILEGMQGKRKSTFIETLGRKWFAELDGDFHDQKQMIELMQGAWIMEIPELTGFSRADVRSIKAFISRKKDRARLAYAKRAGEFPRQCIFIGSTNDREYLKDDTGGRRFWPMECTVTEIDVADLEKNIDQLWAEAVANYRDMRKAQPRGTLPLYLIDEESRITAARLQESRRVESADDALAGRIAAWLERPYNTGGFEDDGDTAKPLDQTCLIQIWCEALSSDMRSYNQASAQMIGRAMKMVPGWSTTGSFTTFPNPYGRQRVYERGGAAGKLARMGI